ncbi:MAG TPA: hypothetical protein VMS64_39085 [Candidatus Methylomirabilis sp.]|nr:hypothetical protein [Candidatus Methylomirabilis sp.]
MTHLLSALGEADTPFRVLGAALFAFLFVRALQTAEIRPLRSPRWLLARVSLTAAAGLVLVAALNYLVNPLGMYAPRIFEPIVLHSRAEKMRLYRAAQPPPEIVVLGSSSSFTMSPTYIRERTGQVAFNASLHGGVPEDYLAFLRYMESLGKLPKILVVPMSVEQVRPDLPTGFEPHNPLRPYLEREPRSVLADLRRLMTLEQTRASLRLLVAERWGRPPPHYRFDHDGWAHFVDSGASLDTIVDSYLATKEWSAGLYKFRDLDETQMVYFRRFLELARDLGVKVIVYVPPLHPRAVAFYERETNLPALRTQLLEQLRAWETGGLIAGLHDFTRVESFGGNASQFHDLAHPTAEASRRMLDVIFGPRPARS